MNTNKRELPNNGLMKSLICFRVFSGFLALSFLTSSAVADPFGTNLTLRSALEYGAENNPQLQAAWNQWRGFEENIEYLSRLREEGDTSWSGLENERPPAILFFDRAGNELRNHRLVGYFEADEFATHLQKVLDTP